MQNDSRRWLQAIEVLREVPAVGELRRLPRASEVTDDFDRAWALYPRKVAKAHARTMWARLTDAQRFAALQSLPIHVRYWQIAGRDQERIPHFGSWIGGERWEDELEMPQAKTSDEWWRSKAGIEAKARELGMWPPRTGEDWHSLKARILAKAA